jgi:hypothetical protein
VPLELAFATKALRSICEQEEDAIRAFGDQVAVDLRARIADLRAADSVADMVAGHPRLINDHDPRMIIAIMDVAEMVIRPNHPQLGRDTGGAFDWQRVHRVRIDALNVLARGDSS